MQSAYEFSECVLANSMLAYHALRAEEGRETGESLVQARGVPPGAENLERLRLPVEARLDAAHEAVADEDREDVVAVLPLGEELKSNYS
jgi:hypothetical protein